MTTNAARVEANVPKNRYRDISPCKYNTLIKVQLQCIRVIGTLTDKKRKFIEIVHF